MTRRRVLALSLGAATVLTATACSGSSSPSSSAAPSTASTAEKVAPATKAAANPTTQPAYLRWVNPSGDPTDIKIVKDFFKRFQELNPSISVAVENIPSNFDTKLQTEIAGGVPPDVTYVQILTFPGYAARGIFMPLDPFVARDKFDLNQIYPNLVRAFTNKGSIFALPKDNGSSVMVYNKDLFKKHGMTGPPDEWTWNDFLTTAEKLTSGTGPNRQYGFQLNTSIFHWSPWIFQNKAEIFSADATACLLTQPAAQEALQFLADTAAKYHISPTPAEAKDEGYMPLFLNGKVAMQQIWPGNFPQIQKSAKFDWDIAMLPTGKQRGNFINGAGNAVLKTTKFPEQCWILIKFFESKVGQSFFLQAHKGVPSLKAVGTEYVKLPPPPAHRQVCIDDLAFGTAMIGPPTFKQVSDVFDKELADLWNDNADAKTVTDRIVNEVAPLMTEKVQ